MTAAVHASSELSWSELRIWISALLGSDGIVVID
jgi:hypothetical protein